MGAPVPDVTAAELAVLRLLWEQGASAARALTERLYPGGGASSQATVLKLLERLEAKGCVARDRTGPVQTFRAAVAQQDLVDRRLRDVADQFCGGSLAGLFSHLVEGRPMPAKERAVLREFLDSLDDGPDGGR